MCVSSFTSLSLPSLLESFLVGRRYDSSAAVAAGIVDEECAVERLQERAREVAASKMPLALGFTGFAPDSFHSMKMELYTDAYRALSQGVSVTEPHARL